MSGIFSTKYTEVRSWWKMGKRARLPPPLGRRHRKWPWFLRLWSSQHISEKIKLHDFLFTFFGLFSQTMFPHVTLYVQKNSCQHLNRFKMLGVLFYQSVKSLPKYFLTNSTNRTTLICQRLVWPAPSKTNAKTKFLWSPGRVQVRVSRQWLCKLRPDRAVRSGVSPGAGLAWRTQQYLTYLLLSERQVQTRRDRHELRYIYLQSHFYCREVSSSHLPRITYTSRWIGLLYYKSKRSISEYGSTRISNVKCRKIIGKCTWAYHKRLKDISKK